MTFGCCEVFPSVAQNERSMPPLPFLDTLYLVTVCSGVTYTVAVILKITSFLEAIFRFRIKVILNQLVS